MMAETQPTAASTEGKPARTVRTDSGRGRMRSQALTTTPRVPSEPTSRLRTSGPASSTEKRAASPSGMTASRASTWSVVTPYLRQRGPPAFSAMLPPMVETRKLDGSGA